MDFEELTRFRSTHPAWTLLAAQHAPLVLSFLGRVFLDANAAAIAAPDLERELDDELYALNQLLGGRGERVFAQTAATYLDDWASGEKAWLRKYYTTGTSDAVYDISPAAEKAVLWARDLPPREFIGTESRLNTVVDLLRQIAHGTDPDPERRLAELTRQRDELDAEIERVERGEVALLDEAGQRDRYQQVERTSLELTADFRQLDENFRQLDRRVRQKIANWEGSKGEFMEDHFKDRNTIANSDQGRSFQAFYDLLLSYDRRDELNRLLAATEHIPSSWGEDSKISHIQYDWLDAGARTQATVRLLSEQLGRFLDDRVWAENKRVFELLQGIESKALLLREHAGVHPGMELDGTKVDMVLPTERPLYRPSRATAIDDSPLERGDDSFDASVLIDQPFVDRNLLLGRVVSTLGPRTQVELTEVLGGMPLEHGLAELVTYLTLSAPGLNVTFDDDKSVELSWLGDDGVIRAAVVPHTTFTRGTQQEDK
jgi:hypothetical protein